MQNQRILDIVGILLKQEDFITIQQIATILQVSNKTIRNDLQVVGEWVRENQMTLCKKNRHRYPNRGGRQSKIEAAGALSLIHI